MQGPGFLVIWFGLTCPDQFDRFRIPVGYDLHEVDTRRKIGGDEFMLFFANHLRRENPFAVGAVNLHVHSAKQPVALLNQGEIAAGRIREQGEIGVL